MREALRVLKPGGELVICDYLLNRRARLLQLQRRLLDHSVFHWLGHMKFITLEQYQELSARVGFEATRSRDVTRNTLPTYDSRVKFFRSTGLPFRMMGPRIATMRMVEAVSKRGMLDYVFLAFTKAGGQETA